MFWSIRTHQVTPGVLVQIWEEILFDHHNKEYAAMLSVHYKHPGAILSTIFSCFNTYSIKRVKLTVTILYINAIKEQVPVAQATHCLG